MITTDQLVSKIVLDSVFPDDICQKWLRFSDFSTWVTKAGPFFFSNWQKWHKSKMKSHFFCLRMLILLSEVGELRYFKAYKSKISQFIKIFSLKITQITKHSKIRSMMRIFSKICTLMVWLYTPGIR